MIGWKLRGTLGDVTDVWLLGQHIDVPEGNSGVLRRS